MDTRRGRGRGNRKSWNRKDANINKRTTQKDDSTSKKSSRANARLSGSRASDKIVMRTNSTTNDICVDIQSIVPFETQSTTVKFFNDAIKDSENIKELAEALKHPEIFIRKLSNMFERRQKTKKFLLSGRQCSWSADRARLRK